jgi:hypothetical protein
MRFDFLSAALPLTKAFNLRDDGTYESQAYPLVRNMTSTSVEAAGPAELLQAIQEHGASGNCLLKGLLKDPISNQSRAGMTDPRTPTHWIVFDLDRIAGAFASAEAFIAALPPAFHDVTYIHQYSASYGITKTTYRAHLFFLLARPVSPLVLKEWFAGLCYHTEPLRHLVTLSTNNLALSLPVDHTVAQNDKLIYIAPPDCRNFTDPVTERLSLVAKGADFVQYDFPALVPSLSAAHDELLAELREKAGLPARKPKLKLLNGEEVLTNPDGVVVTDIKEQNGYIRLNLNGGDSWAYFFDPENPRLVKNFKGEPNLLLTDIAPDLYRKARDMMPAPTKKTSYVFRDPASDQWYAGVYDPYLRAWELLAPIGSYEKIKAFFATRGGIAPDAEQIPDWDYEFRPYEDEVCDPPRKFVNRFQPTDFMRLAPRNNTLPATAAKILKSVVGGDEIVMDALINWLACIFQHRTKIGTAWVLSGVQGTGKGLLIHELLRPLFGPTCVAKQLHHFSDQFNAFLETSLIVNVDEVRLDSSRGESAKLLAMVKNLITEPTVDIRSMRQNSRQAKSYSNFIFTSNDYDAMRIDRTDRRFNIAPRQETPISVTQAEVDALKLELFDFAGFLASYPADLDRARRPIETEAKEIMRKHGLDSVEQLVDAVLGGDLSFVIRMLSFGMDFRESGVWVEVDKVVRRWAEAANTGKVCVIRRRDLYMLYRYGYDANAKPQRFNRMLEHKNFPPVSQWLDELSGRYVLGTVTVWKCDPEVLQEYASSKEEDTKPATIVQFPRAASE